MEARLRQELRQLLLRVEARPARVDEHSPASASFPAHDVEHGLVFRVRRLEIRDVRRLHYGAAVFRVGDRRVPIWLVGVCRQQVEE